MRPAFPRTDRQHEAGQGSSIDLLKAGKKRFLPSRASAFLRVQWVGWLPASGARANFQTAGEAGHPQILCSCCFLLCEGPG